MRNVMILAAGACLFALTACGGNGDDKLGDQAQDAMENKADALDAAADNATGVTREQLKVQADATRKAGEAKEEAIDESDVNADALSPAQKAEIINAN